MSESRAPGTLFGGVALLERAISYTLGSLHIVTSPALSRRTPCAEWDLRGLLAHMNDSLVALQEAVDVGHVDVGHVDAGHGPGHAHGPGHGPVTGHDDPAADIVDALKGRACRLLGAWAGGGGDLVFVGGCPVSTSIVTCVGAVEVAVHGWDVARACGRHRPIPVELAGELLRLCPAFVAGTDRPARFAPPVAVSPLATSSDRLVAFLGRDPC